MRRQKRDLSQRAFVKGYQAGFTMKTKSSCPYQDQTDTGFEWHRGWREGREDHWQGFDNRAFQQKVTSM